MQLPCPTPESLYKLCDIESAAAIYGTTTPLERHIRHDPVPEPGKFDRSLAGAIFDEPRFHPPRSLMPPTRIIDMN